MSIDPLLADPSPHGSVPPHATRRAAVVLVICALAVLIAVVVLDGGDDEDRTASTVLPATTLLATPPPAPAATTPPIDTPGNVWWLVNRDRPLPAGYVPADLVVADVANAPGAEAVQLTAATAAAFEAMTVEAAAAGHQLQLTSGYRSAADQQVLYDAYVDDLGPEAAARLVAVPGTSEHQTGLAADVGLVGLPDDEVFGSTEASGWVAANAHRFGFTLRYPPAKADITGYADEPWHLRYVGVALATELHTTGLTMEEHFGLVPRPLDDATG
jgi:D-alanyl-D-alanine carboxypeptidase